MVGCKPSWPTASTPASPAKIDAEAEIHVAQHAHIDAEHRHRFQVERSGADADAEPGPTEDEEQSDHGDGDHQHHEQPVAGEEEIFAGERRYQPAGHLERQALRAPDEARAVLDDEGEAECQQQAVERIAPIKAADQHALDDDADDCGQDRRQHQGAPKADIGDHGEGEIAADRQEAAMGEIDHPGQIEDERQAERHQRIERADDQAVKDIEENELRHTPNNITNVPASNDNTVARVRLRTASTDIC